MNISMKKHIPNLLTLGNLLCGTIATILAVQENYQGAAFLVVMGIVFDFFDGFVARLLNVSGNLGKELDSLADMVTSGVVPGIIMFNLLEVSVFSNIEKSIDDEHLWGLISMDTGYLKFVGLLLTLGACYRLAKFNIDTRQSDSFIGLPTPAMSLFVISLPLIQEQTDYVFVQNLIANNYFLIGVTLLLTFLMNAELPLFSLKFKEYRVQNNKVKYLFLITSTLLIISAEILAIPLIIILYVLLSVGRNFSKKDVL